MQAFDGETSKDGPFHPPPAFCYPKTKTASCKRPYQSSLFQKFPWLPYGTINFHSLCCSGVEDLQSIFFLYEATNFRFYQRMLKKVKQNISHLKSKLKIHNLTPPYNCVLGLIWCSASTVKHKTRERL